MRDQLHFLIAEDDTDIAFLVRLFVTRLFPQATITTVHDGQALLAAYGEHGADMILMDHQMPLLTGLEAIRILRATGDAVPILLVTANAHLHYNIPSDTNIAFLLKPIDLDVLSQTIEQLLPLKEKVVSSR